ncbi:hypothetical protein [Tepidimicrobium xylanilyticum]
MKELNERLLNIKSNMREKERLLKMLENAEKQKRVLEEKKAKLLEQLRKEELDVEKLERISIANFINTIIGRKFEKLEKEKEEALAAKLKVDAVNEEIMDLNKGIATIKENIKRLGDLDSEYRLIIDEKKKLIRTLDIEIGNRLDEIIEKESYYIDKKKEVEEAIGAGKSLLYSLRQVDESLQSASNWGLWDVLAGGMIVTMAKHSKIDQAKSEISRVQTLLSKFYRELEDVDGHVNIDIDIGSFLTFADYFFDGLLVDLTLQSRINEAKEKVSDTISKVNSIVRRLESDLGDIIRVIEDLDKERLRIIEKA